MKTLKKFLSVILAVCLLVVGTPLNTIKASDTTTTDTVTITSLVCYPLEIVENTHGYISSDYDYVSGEYKEYYRYNLYPEYKVIFSDGATYSTKSSYIEHNGVEYHLYVTSSQSYTNQLLRGKHTLTAKLYNVSLGIEVSTEFELTILESPIESITFNEISVVEGTSGYITQEYDSETGEYNEYYRYSFSPQYTVKFKDGTEQSNEYGNIVYNGQEYWLSTSDDQSYNNQWGIGTHTVNASIMGYDTSFEVKIKKTPIVNIVAEPITIIEGTNGYYRDEYSDEQIVTYFDYDVINKMSFDVTFEDGTVLENQYHWFDYKGDSYNVSLITDQSWDNPWGRGKHTATLKAGSFSTSCDITIVASPIINVDIYDFQLFQEDENYSNSGPVYEPWFNPERVDITFEDGSVRVVTEDTVVYEGIEYDICYIEDRKSDDPWSIGTHVGTAMVGGLESSFNYHIVSSNVSSIEVVKVAKIYEDEYSYTSYHNGEEVYVYEIPDFVLKVTKSDGTTFYEYYVYNDLYDEDDEYELFQSKTGGTIFASKDTWGEPWVVGGENQFEVSYAGLTTVGYVDIITRENANDIAWEYYEEDGEIYITGCNTTQTTIEIPEQINEIPVVGILSLGPSMEQLKELVIPDSVVILSESVFEDGYSLKKIAIGSGVTYLSASMFENFWDLKEIIVSEDNVNYCSYNNVVYDKNMETIVIYPQGRGNEYTVPASVTNIDVMFYEYARSVNLTFEDESKSFVEEDGIVYCADKTILISCNTSKEGEVILPNNVHVIGKNAFSLCDKITGISIPNSVTHISYGAFSDCTSLSKLELSDNLDHIGGWALSNCVKLKSIELPDSLTKIGSQSFAGTHFTSITLPDSVETIEYNAFGGSKIESITFGTGLNRIERDAFAYSSLLEVSIPDNVTYLGKWAFLSCRKLKDVNLGEGISYVSASCFEGCSQLENVYLKNKSVTLGYQAFMDSGLKNINFEHVAQMEQCVFDGSKFDSLSLPDNITNITYGAFANCSELMQIDIPENIDSINSNSFSDTAWYKNQDTGIVYLEHVLYSYKGFAPSGMQVNVNDGIKVIADNAFAYQDGITSIVLNEEMQVIGDGAFFGCTGLTEIYIPASVTSIGDFSFAGCENISAIYVDAGNEFYSSIDGILYNKEGTELIWCPKQYRDIFVVPETVEVIKTGAFGCSTVPIIEVPNPDTTLEFGAVGYNCVGVQQEITLQKSHITLKCYENSLAYEYAEQYLFDVQLKEVLVEAIEVATLPAKTEYELGETIDTTGLTLNADYSNETSGIVSDGFDVSGFDSMQIGTQTITVSLGGQTTTFDITMTGAQIIGENVRGAVGDTIRVPIRLQDNKGVNYLSIKVAYDSSALELVSAEDQGLLETSFQTSQYTTANPYIMIWAGLAKNDADGELVILTFKILDTAQEGEYPLQIRYTEAYDLDYNDVYFAVTSPVITVKNYIEGDANDDGEINGKDVTMLLRYLADWDVDMNEDAADVNADGEVNGKDVTLLMKYLAEWDVTLG